MFRKIFILIILFSLPLITRAESTGAAAKLEKWQESFEKQNVDLMMADKEYFFLTEDEANRLFESESKKLKNPIAKDFKITLADGLFEFQAVFNKIMKGRIYFAAQPLENKIGIKVLKAKYYGFKIPAKWVEKAINKELDKYFNFLYQAEEYQSARLMIEDKTARLLLEFK